MVALREDRDPVGTDAEAAWYISTRSLDSPIDSEWCKIYQYCFTKTMESMKKDVPEDLRVDKLTDYEMNYHLLPFKRWIYQTRSKAREERSRLERREQKEAAKQQQAEQQAEMQPSIFDFAVKQVQA
jgi:hypothetical protein